jgi:hypothetical protein
VDKDVTMGSFFQVILFVFVGVFLLWFGYTLFFGGVNRSPAHFSGVRKKNRKPLGISYPGAPQTCPVCSARLGPGELVNSSVFPSFTGGKDRLMHIRGCVYCLNEERPRVCPVCGIRLRPAEILIARMFERPGRVHVHVLGCSRCRGTHSR